jgi:hypothetical protein
MKTLMPCLCSCAVVFLMYGCGPMQMPMPVRLDDEGQKNLDQNWDDALTPVGRFNHPALLDAFLLTQAYQIGVDKLSFRSEKKVAVGTVVMEIEYDRLKPDEDRFEVKIYDPTGKLLREERYGRKEVEDANHDLFVRGRDLERIVKGGGATPAEVKELTALQARIEAVAAVFPKDEKNAPEGKEQKRE